ncbi:MAG: hypothetical protein ABW006_04100 [Hyphomicrobium sp.]|jgi:hypothetical protein
MVDQKETAVSEHETPANDRTPTAAKALSIGLIVWVLVGALAVLGVFSFLQTRG